MHFALRSVVFVAMALSTVSACNWHRTPLTVEPDFRGEDVQEIVLLPVIDARPDRFDYVRVSRNVEDATLMFLRQRGYFATASDRFGVRPAGPMDLDHETFEHLSALAPPDARIFMVVQIERLDAEYDSTGEGYHAKLSAALVDRESRRILWRDVASASSNLSGVLTVFARGSRQYEAAVNAARALVETLPKG
ncbi:MAG TPA: hypothetical protein VEL28_22270 [Candidatus Binatia bacterium]|nr:hypothetical protein [Candidatus Binatia bacterium]